MQLLCSLSSGSSSYAGRSLQLPAASLWCLPTSYRRCVVRVRSEKADLWQLLGGRGLPGGEEALKSKVYFGAVKEEKQQDQELKLGEAEKTLKAGDGEDGFEKEMMGLTGGFPGGEEGLKRFIATSCSIVPEASVLPPRSQQRPRAPVPPLLMPGMTVIVKNPRNPFYMYGGIVQRVSDGRVGVLFEGGNWDKLLTFYLEDLERTPSGPPMINPKSAILLQRPPPASPR